MGKKYFFKNITLTLLAVFVGIAFSLGSAGEVNTGVFIDAPVKGLEYSTPTQSGVTNDKGEFTYLDGEDVTFRIDGLEIGKVEGAPEIPVTMLPKYLLVARLLLSLDIDALEELIDISGIKISDALKNELKDLLENDLDNFDAVLTQAKFESIAANSQVVFVNASPVTIEAAIQHILGSISSDFVADDFNRQTYVSFDDIDDAVVLSFEDDGTGFEFRSNQDDSNTPAKIAHAWSISNNKLVINSANGHVNTVGLLSVDENKFVVSIADQDRSIVTIYKAKPFIVSSLDGKILALDTDNDSECSARTIKFTGNTGTIKELCTGFDETPIFYETPITVSKASRLDNTIYIRGVNGEGNNFSVKLNLIDGDLNNGKFSMIFDPANAVPEGVEIQGFHSTDTEVEQPQNPLTKEEFEALFAGKTFYTDAENDAMHFVSSIKFNNEMLSVEVQDESAGNTYTSSLYNINKSSFTFDSHGAAITYTIISKTDDYIAMRASYGQVVNFYFDKAKAEEYLNLPIDSKFTAEWLNGKILYNVHAEYDLAYGSYPAGIHVDAQNFIFTTTSFFTKKFSDTSDLIEKGPLPYHINEFGDLVLVYNEGGRDYENVFRIFEANTDRLTVCIDVTDTTCLLDYSKREYFYFDKAKALAGMVEICADLNCVNSEEY